MNILILYGSIEGQTAKIAKFIADELNRHAHNVTVLSCEGLPQDYSLDQYDAAIVGGSIHMGKYPSYLQKFVAFHKDWFNQVPSALFTVCMAINSQNPDERVQAKAFTDQFVKLTNWQPDMNQVFAGAVKYTQYNFVTRFVMKMISKREGGSTDTAHDHEYTDWEAVSDFSRQFLTEIEQIEHI